MYLVLLLLEWLLLLSSTVMLSPPQSTRPSEDPGKTVMTHEPFQTENFISCFISRAGLIFYRKGVRSVDSKGNKVNQRSLQVNAKPNISGDV